MNATRSALLATFVALAIGCDSKKAVAPNSPPIPKLPVASNRSFEDGQAAFRKGDIEAALKHFHAALEADPRSFLAWARLHETLHLVGRGEEARAEFERKLAASPEDPLWLTLMAIADSKDREARLRKAIQVAPEFAWASYALADVLIAGKKAEEAIRVAERAIQLDPKNGLFHLQKAAALLWARRVKEALEEAAEARKLAPGDERVLVTEAQILLDDNRVEEAIGRLEEAVVIAPAAQAPRTVLCDLRVSTAKASLREFDGHLKEKHFGAAHRAAEMAAIRLADAVRDLPGHESAVRWLPTAEGAVAAALLGRAGQSAEDGKADDARRDRTDAASWLKKAGDHATESGTRDYVADGWLRLGMMSFSTGGALDEKSGAGAKEEFEAALRAFEACLVLRPRSATAAEWADKVRTRLKK